MIGGWRRSGLTIRAYCDQHRLSEQSFYAWRRTLAERDRHAAKTRAHGAPPRSSAARQDAGPDAAGPDAADRRPVFVPVHVVDSPPAPTASTPAPIEVVLTSGRVLRLVSGFDAGLLRQVLAVLEEPSC
jgi:hypothetical protein